jgi:4-hydroxybenzoate polyprenyl transferase
VKFELSKKSMQLSAYKKLIRINQPIGIWLLFLPCLFGIFLTLKQNADFSIPTISYAIFLFLIGSIVMRSAGCVINDLYDQKFDEKVERTKNRPLITKEISRRQAFILLGALLFIGLIILLQFNFHAILSGFVALAMVATYPLMKRITYYPQVFLGLTFNFGIIMSSIAMLDIVSSAAITLYFACTLWTVIYDTFYAYQDINDDLQVGIKSTAIKFGENPKRILLSLSLIMFLTLIFLGLYMQFKIGYFFAIFFAALFLTQKIKHCDFKNPQQCFFAFKANLWVGALILIGIILG